MKWLKSIWQEDKHLRLLILASVVVSIASFAYFYSQDMLLAYGDARARLMMARRVIDGLHPGLEQLGAVWLPLPQIAMIPFIWNDFLYSSGIAGSIISMACYIIAVVFLYKLIVSVTKDKTAGLIGAAAFSNPNILYMQSLPMSEMMFIAFFLMSIYFLMRWVQDVEKPQYLFFTAAAVFLATLTRYEGWALLLVLTAIIVYTFWKNRFKYSRAEGYFIFFATMALFGIFLWLIYSQMIFGDFLYFHRSEYSAKMIHLSMISQMEPSHRTDGNFLLALKVYGRTMLDNAGWITAALSVIGLFYLLFSRRSSIQKITALGLLFPFVFYVIGLYGEAFVIILHPYFAPGQHINLRYGIHILPAAGFFIGFLVQKKKWLKLLVIVLIGMSIIMTCLMGVITVEDPLSNNLSQIKHAEKAAANWLKDHYDGGLVLMQNYKNENVTFIFSSKFHFKEIIYEGDQEIWIKSLEDPVRFARWIFMKGENGNILDKVWKSLHGTSQLIDNYDLVYQDSGIEVYKLKEE